MTYSWKDLMGPEVIDFKVVEDHGNLGDMSDEEMPFGCRGHTYYINKTY